MPAFGIEEYVVRVVTLATKRRFKVVIFDLDGTLIDISERYSSSIRLPIVSHGYEAVGKKRIWSMKRSGLTGKEIISRLIGGQGRGSDSLKNEARLIEAERRNLLDSPSLLKQDRLFPGAVVALNRIKRNGVGTALLSIRKSKKAGEEQISYMGIRGLFDKVVFLNAGTDKDYIRMKLAAMRRIVREFNVDPDEVCVIGDSAHELVAGKKLGAYTIAVAAGISSRRLLSKYMPDVIAVDIRHAMKSI